MFTTSSQENARLRIDACIKLKFLVSVVDVDFKGDESKLCIGLGKIIASCWNDVP